jgi:hypothetical protein
LKEDASSSCYQSLNCLCFFHPWLVEKEEEFLVFLFNPASFFLSFLFEESRRAGGLGLLYGRSASTSIRKLTTEFMAYLPVCPKPYRYVAPSPLLQ